MTSRAVGSSGQRLGRYHLVEPLGGGPTGEVFRAKVYGVAGFERQFAVKRFHPEFISDPDIAAAVAQAARTYGSLEHPRIARLYEHGVASGDTFTATELIEGVDLARLLSVCASMGQPLPPGAATTLVSQAARTVGYAHGRGIFHLGLCPTNLLATAEGEVKVTDFGFLPARLPDRPGHDDSLFARMGYLAPEQLVKEPISAATDVFQLGVIAYELLAGRQPFTGRNVVEISQQILSGKFMPLSVPIPISKVLQRCLARSPFERFPDARALADAIDAAVRSAPLSGGTHDISSAVRAALERMSEMNDSQISGAVSFPVPAPPGKKKQTEREPNSTMRMPALSPAEADSLAAPIGTTTGAEESIKTTPFQSRLPSEPGGNRPAAGSPYFIGPDIKMPPLEDPPGDIDEVPTVIRDRDKGFISVPGAPGAGAAPPGRPPSAPLAARVAPSPPLRPTAAPPPPPRPTAAPPPPPAIAPPPSPPPAPIMAAAAPPLQSRQAMDFDYEPASSQADDESAGPPATIVGYVPSGKMAAAPQGSPALSGGEGIAAPPAGPSPLLPGLEANVPSSGYPLGRDPRKTGDTPPPDLVQRKQGGKSRGLLKGVVAFVLLAGLGGGGYIAYDKLIAGADPANSSTPEQAAVAPDAGSAQKPASTVATGDAGVKVAQTDVPSSAADAGAPPEQPAKQPQSAGTIEVSDEGAPEKLIIRTVPSGAKVYLDGTALGSAPEKLDATADRHRLAVVQPGYGLFMGEIQGKGTVTVTLEEVAPPDGPGGIKVRCRAKNRYYVFLDGTHTGQLCPSERLGVEVGEHTVSVYDPVSDSTRDYPVNVEDTRRSIRIRIEE